MSEAAQKIAIVTGANRGIGLEITRQLAEQGIHVIGTARDENQGKAMVEVMTEAGLSVSTYPLEVTDHTQCKAFIDYVLATHGRIDILVNNAGIAIDQWVSGFELDLDVIRKTIDVNVIASLDLIQLVIPTMKSQGSGRIVNLSTELASMTATQMGSTVAYRLSKAALNMTTRLLALELKEDPDILINAAAPGWCQTELGGEGADRSAAEGADTPVWLATLDAGGPSGGFYRDRKEFPW